MLSYHHENLSAAFSSEILSRCLWICPESKICCKQYDRHLVPIGWPGTELLSSWSQHGSKYLCVDCCMSANTVGQQAMTQKHRFGPTSTLILVHARCRLCTISQTIVVCASSTILHVHMLAENLFGVHKVFLHRLQPSLKVVVPTSWVSVCACSVKPA